MRFLGIGDSVGLNGLYLRLAARGHQVRVCAEDSDFNDPLDAPLERTADWRLDKDWLRAAVSTASPCSRLVRMGPLRKSCAGKGSTPSAAVHWAIGSNPTALLGRA